MARSVSLDHFKPKASFPSRRLVLASAAAVAVGATWLAAAPASATSDKEHAMKTDDTKFTPSNAAILLIDHQPGVLAMVGSLPHDVVTKNAALLARLGDQLDIPLVVTSTRENMEFLGTNLKEIQTAAPTAYANRIRRGGTLDAFKERAFVDAVASTRRRNLVIAGILTDVCLYHSVVSALEDGYKVQVVADACGTSTTLADTVTYDRLRSLGGVVTSTYGILFQLYPDLSTPEGQKAQAVANASVGGGH